MNISSVTVNGRVYELAPVEPPASDTPTSEWYAIAPAVAERWLRANKANRSLRERQFTAQKRDIIAGNWQINGETIKLSRPLLKGEVDDLPEGYVLFLDGQHRLEACIESKQPFVSLVVWGLEPETRNTMDTGISRTMNDVLRMDNESYAPVLGSVLRRVWMWRTSDYKFNGKLRPTHAELLELFEKDPEGFRSAADKGYWVKSGYADIAPAVVATAYYLCAEVDQEEAPWFFARLKDGAELSIGHPILALRARLTRERAEKRHTVPHHQLALILKTWNLYREDAVISRLQQAIDDPTPMPK